MFKVTGREFVQGYRDGNINKATFDTPTSICVYNWNRTKILLGRALKPVYLFKNASSDPNCLKYMTV